MPKKIPKGIKKDLVWAVLLVVAILFVFMIVVSISSKVYGIDSVKIMGNRIFNLISINNTEEFKIEINDVERLKINKSTSGFFGDVINIGNVNGSSSFIEQNINNGSEAVSAIQIKSNVGRTCEIGIGSDGFEFIGIPFPNAPTLFCRTPQPFFFGNTFSVGWIWVADTVESVIFQNENMPTIIAASLGPTGDFNISGNFIGNQIYGEMYINDSFAVSIPSSNIWTNITMDASGELNRFDFVNSNGLSARIPGLYKIDTHFNYVAQANTEFHTTLAINDVKENVKCIGESRIGNANDVGELSFTCFKRLSLGDVVHLQIINLDTAGDPVVTVGNFNLIRIGD